MRKICTFLLGLLFFGASHSQVLFVDHFDYGTTPGAIISQTGSPWVANTSGGATNPIQYDPGSSLVFGTYPAFGGKVKLIPNGQDITAPLNASVTADSVYACMLVNFSAAQTVGDYFCHFMPNTTTNSYFARLFVRLSGTNNINFGLMKNNGGATPYSPNLYDLNKTYCLVLKYTFRPEGTTNDTASLYVFDVSTGGVPATEPGTPEMNIFANTDATSIGAIGVRQGATSGASTMFMDHITVSKSWVTMLQALPLQLQSFTCRPLANGTSIDWVAFNETNFDHYELEKSYNGSSFTKIASVKGSAAAMQKAVYNYTDLAPLADIQYYRLVMVDKDGAKRYSQIIFRGMKTMMDVTLYPNPVAAEAVVTHPVIKPGTILQMVTIDGKLVKTLTPVAGSTQTIFSTQKLAPGTYLLVAISEGKTSTVRFVKQ
jgi:hypothetical protein